jgi:hypothetical protein
MSEKKPTRANDDADRGTHNAKRPVSRLRQLLAPLHPIDGIAVRILRGRGNADEITETETKDQFQL